jgi:hypothetical protein
MDFMWIRISICARGELEGTARVGRNVAACNSVRERESMNRRAGNGEMQIRLIVAADVRRL